MLSGECSLYSVNSNLSFSKHKLQGLQHTFLYLYNTNLLASKSYGWNSATKKGLMFMKVQG